MARRDLQALAPYAHAVDVRTLPPHPGLGRVVRLGSNESPLGPSPLAVEAMRRVAADAGRYPQADSARLIQAIAGHVALPERYISVGNGGDECIDLLLRVQANTGGPEPDVALACRPCFDVYRTQSLVCGLRFEQVPLKPDFSLPLEDLVRAAGSIHPAPDGAGRLAVVFVTSPDNPSGLATPRDALLELARSLPEDAVLLVDEAYIDFCEAPETATCLPFVPELPNLGVLRTFSKAYGLAGARLGFMALPEQLTDLVRRTQIPFSVNLFAQQGGQAALQDRKHREHLQALIREERAYLLHELRTLGCEVPESQANFVMLRPPCAAEDLFNHLLSQGILLRNLAPNGLPGWLRATVGTQEECAALVEEVGRFLGRYS